MLDSNIEQLGLQANFTSEQRKYFDKLKAELLGLFGGQTYGEIKASENVTLLKKISDKLAKLEDFVKNKNLPESENEVGEALWTRERFVAWARDELQDKFPESWVNRFISIGERRIQMKSSMILRGLKEKLKSFPDDLSVAGNLDLSNSQLKRFPNHLHVKGDLILTNSAFTELGPGLRVEGDLYIKGLPEQIYNFAIQSKLRQRIKGEIHYHE